MLRVDMSIDTKAKIGIIILAAGEGKRMESAVPKVMHRLKGKTLITHVVEAVEKSGLGVRPVVVVSPQHMFVQEELGDRAVYAVQNEQLGTGHAVGQAEPMLKGVAEDVLVLYGDMPFITGASMRSLVEEHMTQQAAITLATVTVSDFDDWRSALYDFGRIMRDTNGIIAADVEKRDATPEQMAIRELNSGFYCFKSDWLWKHLKKIEKAIRSFEEQIRKHERKIFEYKGKKDYLGQYWGGEIKNYKRQIKELKKKLEKK
jgi:bifunctional UDP-N-acetylglucosamine pyrophosphorylase/glucosamine-1-phosphate N-acetyltransferase